MPNSRAPPRVERVTQRQWFPLSPALDNDNGILLFSGPEESQSDYLAVYIAEGRVVFAFDTGDGIVLVRTNGTYTDGEWHSVRASRITVADIVVLVDLVVDMETVSDSFTLGNSGGFLDISELVYVGGVDSNAITLPEALVSAGAVATFTGCVDDVTIDGLELTINSQSFLRARRVVACTSATFTEERAYVAYPGAQTETTDEGAISLRFRTSQEQALLLFLGPSQSSGDYFLLSLRGGDIFLAFDLGNGVNVAGTSGRWRGGWVGMGDITSRLGQFVSRPGGLLTRRAPDVCLSSSRQAPTWTTTSGTRSRSSVPRAASSSLWTTVLPSRFQTLV